MSGLVEKTAPSGSAITARRNPAASWGAAITAPPSSAARAALASASLTQKSTLQCGARFLKLFPPPTPALNPARS